MKRKIMVLLLALSVATLGAANVAFGISYFGYDDWGGTWHDAEKSLTNPDDDWMCWAAAAANILDWTAWDVPMFDSEIDMFYNFQDHWSDQTGLMGYGWNWWFDGTNPQQGANPAADDQPGWSQVDVAGGGSHWSSYNFFDYFYEDWAWDNSSSQWIDTGLGLMKTIADYLHSGYGTTLAIYSGGNGHALTAWGYEYDAPGAYTGVWVTDSDDYTNQLKLLSVQQDLNGLWRLGGNQYDNWFIGGVQALDRNPIPEPGTLLLLGLGLISVTALKREDPCRSFDENVKVRRTSTQNLR
jgi:hypothetical protein